MARLLWFVLRGVGQLITKGVSYVYRHRVQIIQYKYTLSIVMVLSVAWAGWRLYNHFSEPVPAEDTAYQGETNGNASDVPTQPSYAVLAADETPAQPSNIALITSIYNWLGTPHRDGGTSKRGTDCSYFVQSVYQEAYGIELNRNSARMYEEDIKAIRKEDLREGDLVFFNTTGGGISHVGIYLRNGMFVHASSSKGVIVESLATPYYQKNYAGSGRVKARS